MLETTKGADVEAEAMRWLYYVDRRYGEQREKEDGMAVWVARKAGHTALA